MPKKGILTDDFRFKIARIVLILCSIIVIFRLFQIQVLNHTRYKAEAKRQQFHENIIYAKRGDILTSDGYHVAQSILGYTLFATPSKIQRPKDVADQLSQILLKDKAELLGLLQSDTTRAFLASGIDTMQKDQIERIEMDGLILQTEYKRYYPEKNMLSHVMGFVGKDRNGYEVGYYGIEQFYDGDLAGRPGETLQEKSAGGDIIVTGGSETINPVDGSDIVLTIDRNVQFIVERILKEGVQKYASKSGSVLVINPATGDVISMANYPDFNPSEFTKYFDDKDILRNNTISVIYEPGSVIKAITMASAMDAGKVNLESTYNDTGPRIFSGHKVDNWDGKHHGIETMTSILQHSNNLGAAWVGLQVGDENLLKYFSEFGLGRRLGIDLEGEEVGITYSKLPLKDIEIANASFGQGISYTPLQVTMAFSSIANNGYLMKPKIVGKIVNNTGEVKIIKNEILSRPITQGNAEIMVKMLTDAVAGGEAKFFVTKKYKVAGKTGTAQVPIKGGYDDERTNATFVGFFPSYRNFVMLVRLEEPRSPSGYAAETAVPLWMNISEELARYYNLPPDK